MESETREFFKRKREEMKQLHYEGSKRRLVEDYQELEREKDEMERDIQRRMENLSEVKEQMKRVDLSIKQGDKVLAAQVAIIDDIIEKVHGRNSFQRAEADSSRESSHSGNSTTPEESTRAATRSTRTRGSRLTARHLGVSTPASSVTQPVGRISTKSYTNIEFLPDWPTIMTFDKQRTWYEVWCPHCRSNVSIFQPDSFIKGPMAMWSHLSRVHKGNAEIDSLVGRGPGQSSSSRMGYIKANCVLRTVDRAEVEKLNDSNSNASIRIRRP